MSRYCIGIDLGTTSSAICYVEKGNVKLFRIPQLNTYGVIESISTLPSFHYLAEKDELPGQDFAVGLWARERGAKVPTRLIQSAKSWLSNPAANRKEKILPLEVADPKRRLSPVEVSASYLLHIREAWNAHFQEPIEDQDIVLTVPASFDEVARSLTVEAAHVVGLTRLTLLEEPQAAFYNWLMEHEVQLESFQEGETILVCDIGGGTTDFSLIEVIRLKGTIGFRRMAVGKHLLLGGDNMDETLCHFVENQLGQELDLEQWQLLRHQARVAKEALLGGEPTHSIRLAGKGARVVGGATTTALVKEEVEHLLLEGFFGFYTYDKALTLNHGSGIRNKGLPYESEPSITKHLAGFLKAYSKPTYLLFNGGATKPALFQTRVIQSIETWFPDRSPITILRSSTLDLAVARGAAYFGKVRKGEGVRIKGGIPRAYYLEVEKKEVMTVLQRGTEEGSTVTFDQSFSLLPNTPICLQLYHSHTRLNDKSGSILSFEEEEMTPLPPIQTVLRFGTHHDERIPVKLHIHVTEIGVLEMWLHSIQTEHRWKLEFQLNGYIKERRLEDETVDSAFLEPAKVALVEAFSIGNHTKLKNIMTHLEEVIDRPRVHWSPSILRELYALVLSHADKRVLSSAYAHRFWNLVGFLLRPGCGYPLDDFRIKEIWKLILTDAKQTITDEVQIQKWICYRRLCAGFSKGQQMRLFAEIFLQVYDKKKRCLLVKPKNKSFYEEQIRALGALELVDLPLKQKLAQALVDKIVNGSAQPCDLWALARLGARELLYGTVVNVIGKDICEQWVLQILDKVNPHLCFVLISLSHRTHCREVNLPSATRDLVRKYLERHGVEEDLTLFTQQRGRTVVEEERRFGDSLPVGLKLTL